jgi:radical SAM protein with 4Fe4S-binding SPASM domain
MKKKLWIWIDPTRNCNLSCALCYTKESHTKSDLSLENARHIFSAIAQAVEYDIQLVHLNWRGEPLMNRNFLHILSLAARRLPMPIHWHTNGILLSPAVCEQVCRINANMKIYVSIDGGTRETHDKNRGEGSFEKSLNGLLNLLQTRGENKTPFIGVYQINLGVAPENYDPRFIALLKKVNQHICINPLYPDAETVTLFGNHKKAAQTHHNVEMYNYNGHIPNGPCFWAGNSLSISPEGHVSVCLVSHRDDGIIGNIFTQPLDEIVQASEAFRHRILEKGRKQVPHCARCAKPEVAEEKKPEAVTAAGH